MGKEKIRNRNGILNASYKLGKYERVNMEEVKILVNGTVKGLVPVAVYEKRGLLLEIEQQGWTPLEAYQGAYLTDAVVMAFLKNTVRIAYDCERYGLRIDNLCWDFNKVFVDSQRNIRMIYWPVTTLVRDTDAALNFYRKFCELMKLCGRINPQIIYRYESYFYQRENLDFPVFHQLMAELIEQWQQEVRQRNQNEEQEKKAQKFHSGEKAYFGWLERTSTGARYPLNCECMHIGRDDRVCQLLLTGHITVARVHAQLKRSEGRYYLIDLGSRNGTRVNNVKLEKGKPRPLTNGEKIKFAEVEFVFLDAMESDTISIHQKKRGKV